MGRAIVFFFVLMGLLKPASIASCPSTLLAGAGMQPASYMDDVSLGKRWAIYRDCAHPEAPGRLIAAPLPQPGIMGMENVTVTVPHNFVVQILSGEHVTVLKDAEMLHVRLQAIATERASLGQRIRVRLIAGRAVLSAVVVGPGQVALEPLQESPATGSWRTP